MINEMKIFFMTTFISKNSLLYFNDTHEKDFEKSGARCREY